MSQWKSVDMQCLYCGHQEARTVDKRVPDLHVKEFGGDLAGNHGELCTQKAWEEAQDVYLNGYEGGGESQLLAPPCNGPMVPIMSAVSLCTVVRGNSDFAERQGRRLAKRSNEHFKREGREEAIERQRMQWKREGMLP